MDVALLGPLAVTRNGSRLELTGPKRRALLILLALHAGTPLAVDRIIEALWPDDRTGREPSTLRVHVSHLRDQLESDRGAEPRVIVTTGSGYMLSSDRVDLDVRRFEALASEGRELLEEHPDVALVRLDAALRLWRGRPLQDVEYEEFAQDWIHRLMTARTHVSEDRAEALLATGHETSAVEDLESMVRAHPTRERPVLLLMRSLYRTGRQTDALRVARRHSRRLAEEGLEPSPKLALLEDQILTHDPSLLAPASTAPDNIMAGRAVRGYELREEVGSGSVGVVYRAFQPSVGREVAVKVVHPHLAQIPEFVRGFSEEARLVARLQHPHIVPLHDFWREPAGAFLVMRWMDGGSLGDRLGEPWTDVAIGKAFGQIASALGHAHSTGIVHRDVKPSNILFDAAGNAYLSDFGMAVSGLETRGSHSPSRRAEPPYAAPETLRGEGPSVASDIHGLGAILDEVLSSGGKPGVRDQLHEVVRVSTAPHPADRYPDVEAFAAALTDALGPAKVTAPRRIRRNPYKGLAPFEEGDSADFYGRDDVVEQLLHVLATEAITAVIGASGSGKSSLIKAGLIPMLRRGALPGSDDWAIVEMSPRAQPFDEFHVALRSAAITHPGSARLGGERELRDAFEAALDGPTSKGLLFIDQFEEVFSTDVEDETRTRFLNNLSDLVTDRSRRIRVVLTVRADFSDRPLAHERIGGLVARGSVLLAPMPAEQLEDVIRRPAARVGVGVEPGLVSEIVRDLSSASAYLPLLQYVLSELFERRTEDRLTVHAYRSLGGVRGVLERRAEETFALLDSEAQVASRQLFLRMVHLGAHGEETRRRLPLTEIRGLGAGASVEEALDSFARARLLTYDRDPVTRSPTVEVAHETVISNWTRYRVWIDEARADILAHRHLSNAAVTWTEADEHPSYLLSGGPLAAAKDVISAERVTLNQLERRFVTESEAAHEASRRAEVERRRQEADLRQRSKRRLMMGIGAAAIAIVVGLLAAVAFVQGQRASALAASQERRSLARQLASLSGAHLNSTDPDLALLLAIASAEETFEEDSEILSEAVDALHQALIDPIPEISIEGGNGALNGQTLAYTSDGEALVALAADGGALILDRSTGDTIEDIPPGEEPASGVLAHPAGNRVAMLGEHSLQEWGWQPLDPIGQYSVPGDASITTAAYAPDGSLLAVGCADGRIHLFDVRTGRMVATLEDSELLTPTEGDGVYTIAFDPSGSLLASSTEDASRRDGRLVVWDLESRVVVHELSRLQPLSTPIRQLDWHPAGPLVVGTAFHGETLAWNGLNGERDKTYGAGNTPSASVEIGPTGTFLITAGRDGVARIYGTSVGGDTAIELAVPGVPMGDAAIAPDFLESQEMATVGADGRILIWRNMFRSELDPIRTDFFLAPRGTGSSDGSRMAIDTTQFWYGQQEEKANGTLVVFDSATHETLFAASTMPRIWPIQPAMTADGSQVGYLDPDGAIRIATVDSGTTRVVVPPSENPYMEPVSGESGIRIALSPDGRLLAWSGPDGLIRVWDVAAGRQTRELRGHGDRVPETGSQPQRRSEIEVLEFRPDSTEFASAGYDGTIRLWDPETGEGRVLVEFPYAGGSLSFSADGALLAVSDRLGNVSTVDVETGEVVQDLESVPGTTILTFSPDGRRVVGSGPGLFVHVWDLESGRIARRIEGALFPPSDVTFLNGGRQILVLSTEGIVRGYHLDHGDLLEEAREEVSREMTEAECRRYLGRPCDE